MRRFLIVLLLACTSPVCAQHDHHSMMSTSSNAQLELRDNSGAQVLTVRVGPLALPANSDHMHVAQAPEFFLNQPFEGWITA